MRVWPVLILCLIVFNVLARENTSEACLVWFLKLVEACSIYSIMNLLWTYVWNIPFTKELQNHWKTLTSLPVSNWLWNQIFGDKCKIQHKCGRGKRWVLHLGASWITSVEVCSMICWAFSPDLGPEVPAVLLGLLLQSSCFWFSGNVWDCFINGCSQTGLLLL